MERKELGIWRTKSGGTCSNEQKESQTCNLSRCHVTKLGALQMCTKVVVFIEEKLRPLKEYLTR